MIDARVRRPARRVTGGPGYVGSEYGLGKPSYYGIGSRPDWGRGSRRLRDGRAAQDHDPVRIALPGAGRSGCPMLVGSARLQGALPEPPCPALTLADAATIVDAALAEARKQSLAPMTVVVLDAGGHMVALKREDRSGILRVEIASGKAWGALGMGAGSRMLADRVGSGALGAAFVGAAAAASGGRLVPVPGGVLVKGPDGRIVGAVGVSGDASDKDEACAVAGIAAAGLAADTGAA